MCSYVIVEVVHNKEGGIKVREVEGVGIGPKGDGLITTGVWLDVGQVAQVGHNNKMVKMELLFDGIQAFMDIEVVEVEERFKEVDKFFVHDLSIF